MIGKKIGVQAANESIWNAFLKANNIDASKITKVPAQFDPTPLANRQVDGWFSFVTNEPNLLKVKGVDTYTFLLNDYNYPLDHHTYFVKTDTLTDKAKRERSSSSCVRRSRAGRTTSRTRPSGATLTVNDYGKALEARRERADAGERCRQHADPERRHQGARSVLDD